MPINNNEYPAFRGLHRINNTSLQARRIYLSTILVFASLLFALPFVYINTSIQASGIIRPGLERAGIKSPISGMISVVGATEGAYVQKGHVLFRIEDSALRHKQNDLKKRIALEAGLASDLQILLKDQDRQGLDKRLTFSVYRQQARQYASQRLEWSVQLNKVKSDLFLNEQLAHDKIIAPALFMEKQMEFQRVTAASSAFEGMQYTKWEQELADRIDRLQVLRLDLNQLAEQEKLYRIQSPVSGTVQHIDDKYPGAAVGEGETLCMISPESDLIVECWVNGRDVGVIHENQNVLFRIFSFNQGHRVLPGSVITVGNDYTNQDGQPMFRIRCNINPAKLLIDDPYNEILRKGMTVHARFMTQRRSLWHLLYEQAEDWLYPKAQVE